MTECEGRKEVKRRMIRGKKGKKEGMRREGRRLKEE